MLSKEQVMRLHERMIYDTGGLGGVRDEGSLESALASPFQRFEGGELYPTALEKIVRVVFCLIDSRPFFDGNKRIGTCVLLVLLELNQIVADFDDDALVNIGMGVAAGKIDEGHLHELIARQIPKPAKTGLWLCEQEGGYGTQSLAEL